MLDDVIAERAVLAGLFKYGSEVFDSIRDIIEESVFTINSNKVIWLCCEKNLKENNVNTLDYPSILSSANSIGLPHFFSTEVEMTHLRSIANFPIEKETVVKMASKIKKLHLARLAREKIHECDKKLKEITGDEKVDQIISTLETPIFEFTSSLSNINNNVGSISEGIIEHITNLADNPRQQMGISTGYNLYDSLIGGGLRKNALDVIVSRMKVGKSFLVDNIGMFIASNGIPVLNCDTEMSREEHQIRILANLSGVKSKEIEKGTFGQDKIKKKKVFEAAEKVKSVPYDYICTIGQSIEEVFGQMRRWVVRKVGLDSNGHANPCVVIFDYLKIMDQSALKSNLAEHQLLGFLTMNLKDFAGKYQLPILSFAQVNRQGLEDEDTSIIAGSDRISMFATSISLYKFKTEEERAEEPNGSPRYTHKMIGLASRHGERLNDGDYINFKAQYDIGRITEGPLYSEMLKGKKQNGFEIEPE